MAVKSSKGKAALPLVVRQLRRIKTVPRVFIVVSAVMLGTVAVTSVGYLLERRSTIELSSQVNALSFQRGALQSQIDQQTAQINDLNDQLQNQQDKYSKLSDAVQVEHDGEINSLILKSCGSAPKTLTVPAWDSTPQQVAQYNQSPSAKWSSCVQALDDSFIQTFIDTHNF